MALPSSGNPISFSQMNDELGNSSTATLDLEDAAENGFGLSKPHGMDEMFGLSLSRASISIKSLDGDVQGADPSISEDFDGSWANGELYLCAGAEVPTDDDINFTIDNETDFNSDGTLSNGDTLFAASTGTTLSPLRAFQGDKFYVETTTDKIFQLDSNALISNVTSRTPVVPTKPTLVANSGTQITVTIPSTNTVVTKEFDIHRSIGGGSFARVATVSPSSRGNTSNTSVSTNYVDSSGISAGNSVVYKVFAQNAFATSSASTTSDSVTTPVGTSISSSPTGESILVFSNETTIGPEQQSGLLTVSITNRGSNTVAISRTQNTSGLFTVAYSTSGDPGVSGTANGGSNFGTGTGGSPLSSDTIYIRAEFDEDGKNVSEGPTNNTINVTCNGVTLNINVSCRVTNF